MMPVNSLRNYLLETLSFYEKMSLERIILEFDSAILEQQKGWTMDVLRHELEKLVIEGFVVVSTENKEKYYTRRLPPKGAMATIKQWLRWTKARIKTK